MVKINPAQGKDSKLISSIGLYHTPVNKH